jgi:hypothetical protein
MARHTDSAYDALMGDELEVHEPGYCIGVWHEVMYSAFRTQATLESLAKVRHAIEELAKRTPGKIYTVTVLEPSAFDNSMPAAVREEASRIVRDMAPRTGATVTVIEGTGFRSATARLVTSGVYLLSRQTFPTKVFGTVPEAARWLLTLAGRKSSADSDSISAAIELARSRLAPLSERA